MMLLMVMSMAVNAQTRKYLGGDISMLPSYQEKGTIYKDYKGNPVKLLPWLKKQGWNMIRVRLFVDPQNAPDSHKGEGVCQDLNYVIGLCQQIKKAGMQVNVVPVTTAEYGVSKARRPFNSRLDKEKLTRKGFERLPSWSDALERYLKMISAGGNMV